MLVSTRVTTYSLAIIVASVGTITACGSDGGDLADARLVRIDATSGVPDAHDVSPDARARADAGNTAPDANLTSPDAAVTTPDAQQTPDARNAVPDARPAAICGNGIVESGEQCDDHNLVDYDGCTNHCISTGSPVIRIDTPPAGAPTAFFVDDDYAIGVDQPGQFSTYAARTTNSIDGQEDSADQLYLYDAVANTTTKISLNTAGDEGHSDSIQSSLSSDGRYLVWQSVSDNFATVPANTVNIFVRDLQLGVTSLVSASADGTPGNSHSFNGHISADGNFVVFSSYATNLTPQGANGTGDVYVRDLQNQTVTKITDRPSNDGIGNQGSYDSSNSISGDGGFVLFNVNYGDLVASDVAGSSGLFVRDTQQNETTLLNFHPPAGLLSDGSNQPTGQVMSANGRYVMFASSADYLVAGAPAGVYQLYVQDLVTGLTTIASVSSTGDIGTSTGVGPIAISGDGRFVAFSYALRFLGGLQVNVLALRVFAQANYEPDNTASVTLGLRLVL